jgi:glycosyltransferase involved in cell wall biosynthesis
MLAYSFYEIDTRIMQYATALAERGDTVDVLALRREGGLDFEVFNGVNVYRIQCRKMNERGWFDYLFRTLRFLFISAFVLAKRHISKPYQVIHIHSVPDFLVFAAVVPKISGARVILDIHDILPEFYASKFGISSRSLLFKLLVLTERLSIAFSDHVIIANHLWQERLVSRSVRREKCTAIVNYPDPRIFYRRAHRAADRKFIILYPGTLNQHQGVDIAVRAFARVAEKMPGAEFHIYGEGPDKASLIRLSNGLGLTDRVIFYGILPTTEIATVMANSDLAVVPKRASSSFGNEAASTKIMEFMSLGIPVIVSRTKIDTYYHNDSMVKFFESENESDLADSMVLLYSNPELREGFVEGANRFVERNTWQVKKQEYLSLVDHLHTGSVVSKVANGQ